MSEARRLNEVVRQLNRALYEPTQPMLRRRVLELRTEVESWIEGRSLSSVDARAAERCDTIPCPPPVDFGAEFEDGWDVDLTNCGPSTEPESAPPVPVERPSAGP